MVLIKRRGRGTGAERYVPTVRNQLGHNIKEEIYGRFEQFIGHALLIVLMDIYRCVNVLLVTSCTRMREVRLTKRVGRQYLYVLYVLESYGLVIYYY